MSPLLEGKSAIRMARHDRHVLKMALTPFVADRAIVRMIRHQPFDDGRPELPGFRIVDGDPHAVADRRHTGHDDPALRVFFVSERLDRTLAARAHRVHGRMPTEVRKIEAKTDAGLEQ